MNSINRSNKEQRFLDELEALFTGAEVAGDSGFVNLMRIKSNYFRSILPILMAGINEKTKQNSSFREELFDKLYTFFNRYFCESGSIYFRHLPVFSKIYERVYVDGKDIALSWKTRMLYYVKSDVLVRSMPIELKDDEKPSNIKRFYFDASSCEHKQNNERSGFVFAFEAIKTKAKNKIININVSYSRRGKKTNADDIIKKARKAGIPLADDQLQKAINVFCRQTEVDFFINKDAKDFLREQFDLWAYKYIFQEETVFEEQRIREIQAIKDTAYNIIDFISQFEDELRKIWEKPKFVRGMNYVVTIDKLPDALLGKIIRHSGAASQIKEWRELGIVKGKFSINDIFVDRQSLSEKNGVVGKYRFLPLDTRHFKDLELSILSALGNLDKVLDGELVHSENWQALNSLQNKYRKKVTCIYIDPPFNLGSSDQFDYRTNYKDSCWATMLENRLVLAREFLADDGGIFVRCDHNGNFIVRLLMDEIFGGNNHRNEIVVKRTRTLKGESKRFATSQDSLYLYSKDISQFIFEGYRKLKPEKEWKWATMHLPGERKDKELLYRNFSGINGPKKLKAPEGRRWILGQEALDDAISRKLVRMNEKKKVPEFFNKDETLGTNWLDISGYAKDWKFQTGNSEKLLERSIKSITKEKSLCLDFFSGSATTQAVAHKLGRKWLGIEMGEQFHKVVLPRLKKVLSGHKSGISSMTKYEGGGAFKYYALEQYEETLRNARFKDGEQLELDSVKSPFEQYVFFGDEKLAYAIKSLKKNKLEINLHNLYPNIDIAESLANILGKTIRARTVDKVTFSDGSVEKINPAKMTAKEQQHFIALMKPYLWWGSK